MVTNYPTGLDDFSQPGTTHQEIEDAVEAIQETLGVNPTTPKIIAEKAVDDEPLTYPLGVSMFAVVTEDFWPDVEGHVITTRASTYNGSQTFHSLSGDAWVRSVDENGLNYWGNWIHTGNIVRVYYTSTAPARPFGAKYVEWVGPGTPTMSTGDTWVNTST